MRAIPAVSMRSRSDISTIRIPEPFVPNDVLQSAWFKHHLFILGLDKVKLFAYKRMSALATNHGGGILKTAVFDMSLFVKSNWHSESELFHHVLSYLQLAADRLKDFRWFYVCVGYLMITDSEQKLEPLFEKVLELYLRDANNDIRLDRSLTRTDAQVLKLALEFYKLASIDYRALYDPSRQVRRISIGDPEKTIQLPTLPQLRSKHLLAKALMHKEMYRALCSPNHSFGKLLLQKDILIDKSISNVIRYDLSFLDGLGDFFLATESSEFLYKFRQLDPYAADTSFGKKTYTLLRTILATNTLLSRLALAYNLPTALRDEGVLAELRESYVPYTFSGTEPEDDLVKRYEEEFIADYFEQYVGALYLEQPARAKTWINLLFEGILFSITDDYKVLHRRRKKLREFHYDYRAWSCDVIGRSV